MRVASFPGLVRSSLVVEGLGSFIMCTGRILRQRTMFGVLLSPCTMKLEVETSQACMIDYSHKLSTSKMIQHQEGGGKPERACIADLMFRHGTQILDKSRICHCLLFHEHGKQSFVQPFFRSRKLLQLRTHLD